MSARQGAVFRFAILASLLLASCSLPSSRGGSSREPTEVYVQPDSSYEGETTSSGFGDPEDYALQVVLQCWNDYLVPDGNGDLMNPETGTKFRIITAEASTSVLSDADAANGYIWDGDVEIEYIRDQGYGWTDEQITFYLKLDVNYILYGVQFRPGAAWRDPDMLMYAPFKCSFS